MTSFRDQGILWTVDSWKTVQNDGGYREWEEITAVWSAFGPQPFPNEPKKFIFRPRQIRDYTTGEMLEHPRYIEQ